MAVPVPATLPGIQLVSRLTTPHKRATGYLFLPHLHRHPYRYHTEPADERQRQLGRQPQRLVAGHRRGRRPLLPLVLMNLFRKKYPRWWFDWNLNLTRFSYRVASYFLLLRDEYLRPTRSRRYTWGLHIRTRRPSSGGAGRLSSGSWPSRTILPCGAGYCRLRGLGHRLVRHTVYRALSPRPLDFTVGVLRWGLRVEAYAFR